MKVNFRERIGYSLCGAGIGMGAVPVNMLLLFYLTEVLGLRPGVAGLVVAIPKIWDMAVDPMLGGIIDRLAQRHGRRAPVALVAALAYVVPLWLLFSMPISDTSWAIPLFSIAMLILFSVAQTALGVSQLALADDMTRNPRDRTSLLAFSGVTTAFLTLAATAAVPKLIELGSAPRTGYALMSAILATVTAVTLLLFAISSWRYRVATASESKHQEPLLQAIRDTFGNRAFYRLIAYLIVFGITVGLVSALVPFINKHVLKGGSSGLSILGSIVLIATVAAMPIAALVAKRLGNANALQICNATLVLSFPAMYLASYGPLWTSWIAVAIFGCGGGGLILMVQSSAMDLAKNRLPNGEIVTLGIYLGILVAGQKLGMSAGSIVAGAFLDIIGFASGAESQSLATIDALRYSYTLVPLAIGAFGTVFLWTLREDRVGSSVV